MSVPRPRPFLNALNRFFWESGADGRLRFLQCSTCAKWVHPPQPICPRCLTETVSPQTVPGTGVIDSYTVNYQPWLPDVPVPYVIARVAIDGTDDVILTTNIVDCPVDAVRIDDRVEVGFEHQDGVYYPLFHKSDAASA